jgi:hypothetical protein
MMVAVVLEGVVTAPMLNRGYVLPWVIASAEPLSFNK